MLLTLTAVPMKSRGTTGTRSVSAAVGTPIQEHPSLEYSGGKSGQLGMSRHTKGHILPATDKSALC